MFPGVMAPGIFSVPELGIESLVRMSSRSERVL